MHVLLLIALLVMLLTFEGIDSSIQEENAKYCQSQFTEVSEKIKNNHEHIVFSTNFMRCPSGKQALQEAIESGNYELEGASEDVMVIKKKGLSEKK